uniref:NPH3 domain-containing protein n=1 Tax=Oryza punctata TaxID=4537 RepID=A0A0E0JPJ0_ORYPU
MATMKLGSKPEIFVLEGLTWRCMTELESDVVVEVGEMSFYLHKFPLLSRSGVLQRMIGEYQAPQEDGGGGGGMCMLQLDDIPGGAKAFELAARFCYDVKIELNALNVVCLRCAAEYLLMTDDYAEGNLITQAESFLSDVLANWKDSIKALETCEGVLPTAEDLHIGDQRYFLEEIVALLPAKKGVASTRFLLGMLRTAMLLHASPLCRENLERRIGAQLEDACLDDLLVPNLGYTVETLYDIDCVQRILDYFMSSTDGLGTGYTSPAVAEEGSQLGAPQAGSPSSLSPITMVAKLMDGYLAEVAPDTNLKLPKFQALAAVVPDYARPVDDGIYRAMDIYLKSHPWLSESEREQLCRLMNCQKLSLEACTHAAQNERLPLRVVVQVLFFEQLRLRTSIAGWFFVSGNAAAGGEPHPGGSAIVRKGAAAGQSDPDAEADEGKGKELPAEAITDVKARVSELEKECVSMKQEIRRLGKPRRSWSLLTRKCGFGTKVQQAQPTMSGK